MFSEPAGANRFENPPNCKSNRRAPVAAGWTNVEPPEPQVGQEEEDSVLDAAPDSLSVNVWLLLLSYSTYDARSYCPSSYPI